MVHYVVDIQAFKQSFNRTVFKEVAVLSLQDNAKPLVFLFKPPFAWEALLQEQKSCNRWLEYNYHGLCWEDGNIAFEALQQTLQEALIDSHSIFVKGLEKKNWLGEIVPNKKYWIENAEDLGCPSLRKLPSIENFPCANHSHLCEKTVCALQNVLIVKQYLVNIERTCIG